MLSWQTAAMSCMRKITQEMRKCYWFLKYWRSGLWEDRKQSALGFCQEASSVSAVNKGPHPTPGFFFFFSASLWGITDRFLLRKSLESHQKMTSVLTVPPHVILRVFSSRLPAVIRSSPPYHPLELSQLFRLRQEKELQEHESSYTPKSTTGVHDRKCIYFCSRTSLEWTVRYRITIPHPKNQT